jgi:hypothetical protein
MRVIGNVEVAGSEWQAPASACCRSTFSGFPSQGARGDEWTKPSFGALDIEEPMEMATTKKSPGKKTTKKTAKRSTKAKTAKKSAKKTARRSLKAKRTVKKTKY